MRLWPWGTGTLKPGVIQKPAHQTLPQSSLCIPPADAEGSLKGLSNLYGNSYSWICLSHPTCKISSVEMKDPRFHSVSCWATRAPPRCLQHQSSLSSWSMASPFPLQGLWTCCCHHLEWPFPYAFLLGLSLMVTPRGDLSCTPYLQRSLPTTAFCATSCWFLFTYPNLFF